MKDNTKLLVVSSAAALAVGAGLWYYTPMLAWDRWLELFLLLILLIMFQYRGIGVSRYIKLSLSVSIYLMTIFVYGTGESMWFAVLSNIIFGILAGQEGIKIYLNILQRSLSSLLIGLVYTYLQHNAGQLVLPQSFPAMLSCAVLYTFINLLLVSIFTLLMDPNSLLGLRNAFKPGIWLNSLLFGYIGVIFAAFVTAWQLPGLLAFGMFLIGVSEIMRYSLRLVAEQQRRIQAEQELIVDSKTNVYNYRFLSEWLDQESSTLVTMLFIDIDDFKLFNDMYGHDYGDYVLRTVAQTIRSSVREEDYVVRFGGEEFVVILPHTSRGRGVAIAERIQAKLADLSDAGLKRNLTVSIGIASYPEDAEDRMELLRRADMAMYKAKSLGKNQCCTSG